MLLSLLSWLSCFACVTNVAAAAANKSHHLIRTDVAPAWLCTCWKTAGDGDGCWGSLEVTTEAGYFQSWCFPVSLL